MMDASTYSSRRLQQCTLRDARTADAHSVAQVHVHTWRVAYAGIIPDAVLEGLCVDAHAAKWTAAIETGDPELWVAESQDVIIGWAAFSASRDADASATCGELQAIYVTPTWWAHGVGSALLSRACQRLTNRGFQRVTLWVLQDNDSAIQFYQARGLSPDGGTKQFELAGKSLTELRFSTALQTTASR